MSNSNQSRKYGGKAIGDVSHNNVQQINERKIAVANYRSSKLDAITVPSPTKQPTKSPTKAPVPLISGPTQPTLTCNWNESLVQIIFKTDKHPEEISWDISQNHQVVFSSQPYNYKNAIMEQQKCLPAGSCYTFIINDSGGDGLDNGAYFKVIEAGTSVLEVSDFNTSSSQYSLPVEGTIKHNIGPPGDNRKTCKWLDEQSQAKQNQECSRHYIKGKCVNVCKACAMIVQQDSETLQSVKPSCKWNEALIEVTVKTDDRPEETVWSLTSNNDVVIMSKDNYISPNTVMTEYGCIQAGACYTFILNDSGGNGISNGGYVKMVESGSTILEVYNFGSSSEQYYVPVEGTVRHNIGFPGMDKIECSWLSTQSQSKQNEECSRPYIKTRCVNVCGTCV